MSSIQSFNLLKFVEPKPWLSFNRIIQITLIFILLLSGYSFWRWMSVVDTEKRLKQEAENIQRLVQPLQSFVAQTKNNPLVSIASVNLAKNRQGFYEEFEALSHLHITDLWLTSVVIRRDPFFIQIKGMAKSPDQLNVLLQQLAQQPAFKNIYFKGVEIAPGQLEIPEKYREEVAQLKLPTLYPFTIQTTMIPSSGKPL